MWLLTLGQPREELMIAEETGPRPIPTPIPDPERPPMPDPAPDPGPDEIPFPAVIGLDAIPAALREGWRDFRRAPAFGLLFSAFYVLGGLVLAAVAMASGQEWWLMPFVVGFPLIAPWFY
jgi:hypothetical protein